MPPSAPREQPLLQGVRTLNLSCMARLYPEVALAAAQQHLSHEAFLAELVRAECEHRTEQRRERRLVQSTLPREKTFASLQLDRYSPAVHRAIERVRDGTLVTQAVQVIAVGRPGSGKSHVVAALGAARIARDYPVLPDHCRQSGAAPAGGQTGPAPAGRVGQTGRLCRADPG